MSEETCVSEVRLHFDISFEDQTSSDLNLIGSGLIVGWLGVLLVIYIYSTCRGLVCVYIYMVLIGIHI